MMKSLLRLSLVVLSLGALQINIFAGDLYKDYAAKLQPREKKVLRAYIYYALLEHDSYVAWDEASTNGGSWWSPYAWKLSSAAHEAYYAAQLAAKAIERGGSIQLGNTVFLLNTAASEFQFAAARRRILTDFYTDLLVLGGKLPGEPYYGDTIGFGPDLHHTWPVSDVIEKPLITLQKNDQDVYCLWSHSAVIDRHASTTCLERKAA